MAEMESSEIFTGDRRAEESAHLQFPEAEKKAALEREHLSAFEIMREYTASLEAMSEYLRKVTKEMEQMRMAGIPDQEAYDKLRGEIDEKFGMLKATHERMASLVYDKAKTGDSAQKIARMVLDAQMTLSDEVEDAYKEAVKATATHREKESVVQSLAPESAQGDLTSDAESLALEARRVYENPVVALMKSVMELEAVMGDQRHVDEMDESEKENLRYKLMEFYDNLETLDATTDPRVVDSSDEKRSLLGLIQKLSTELRRPTYGESVKKLHSEASELWQNARFYGSRDIEKFGPALRNDLQNIRTKLKALDDADPTGSKQSLEWEVLTQILGEIDTLLEEPVKAVGTMAKVFDRERYLSRNPMERYDDEVKEILAETVELEEEIDVFVKVGQFDDAARNALRPKLIRLIAQLGELTASSDPDVANASRERRPLEDLFQKLKIKLRPQEFEDALSTARVFHDDVRAQYAAVQHTLSEEQRREMRVSLANIRQAVSELEVSVPLPTALRFAIARATQHAPAIATAALASLSHVIATPQITESRGFLAFLSGVLRREA